MRLCVCVFSKVTERTIDIRNQNIFFTPGKKKIKTEIDREKERKRLIVIIMVFGNLQWCEVCYSGDSLAEFPNSELMNMISMLFNK